MMKPLYCIIDQHSGKIKDKNREKAIANLELDKDKIVPIFEEATQTAASLLNTPISSLGILTGNQYRIKSAYGLSNLGLSNELVRTRTIDRPDSFAVNVIDSGGCLIIENSNLDPFFANSILAQHYYIHSYLGVPLIISSGQCIGCLEVMDLQPRSFSSTEVDTLNLIARWCLAEYEHSYHDVKKSLALSTPPPPHPTQNQEIIISSLPSPVIEEKTKIDDQLDNSQDIGDYQQFLPHPYLQQLSVQLINKLIQKLSIPLTSIIGMSSVLKQQTYGKLNQKQLDYLNIVHNSGQEMTTLVGEINNLANFEPNLEPHIAPVDLENLGRQVIDSLSQPATIREHSLRLSIEPGEKLWHLDREKLKQTLYYLLFSIIEGSRSGGEISVHISNLSSSDQPYQSHLNINCWIRHPWLGDGISFEKVNTYQQVIKEAQKSCQTSSLPEKGELNNNYDYDVICLLFASYLVQMQGGQIDLKGSSASGYRFLLSLPISYPENIKR